MKHGLHLVAFDFDGGSEAIAPNLRTIAETAEAVGFTELTLMDHYFQLPMVGEASLPMLEGYTALGYLAGLTTTIELSLLVTGVTYRHPGILAKVVTTLDVLAGGRASLGLGAAWFEREHLGLGVAFPPLKERFERLEETLKICHQMWSDDDGPFNGKHYQLEETICSPRPVSSPRPKIRVGGSGEKKTLRLVAQYADSCNIFATDPASVAHKISVLHAHCERAGRDPGEIEITIMGFDNPLADPDGYLESLAKYAELGVTTNIVMPRGDMAAFTEELGEKIVGPAAEI